MKRVQYRSSPTSSITAETVTVDGFALSQKDTAGVVTTATRSYTATGMLLTQTDGRGNTTTTLTDIAGRPLVMTDEAGHSTTTVYCDCCDQPALVTDAVISSDPADLSGDTTTWGYDPATGLELSKTYADNTSVLKSYDVFNRLETETNARGKVKRHSYEHARGLLLK